MENFIPPAAPEDKPKTKLEQQLILMYRHNYKELIAYVYGFVYNESDALDILQDVFMAAHNDMVNKGQKPENMRAWLFRIAHNRCLNIKKRAKVIDKNFELMTQKYTGSSQFEPGLLDNMLIRDIIRYVESEFSAKEKEIFKLRLMHEMTLDEIKEITTLSTATISRITGNVLEKIRAKFSKESADKLSYLLMV